MSDAHTNVPDVHDNPGHGHGHDEAALGPIDTAAWGAGVLGVAIAVVMAICFAAATSGIG